MPRFGPGPLSSDPGDRDLGLTLAAILVVPIIGCATFDFAGFATANALAFLIAGAAGSLLRTAKSDQTSRESEMDTLSGAQGLRTMPWLCRYPTGSSIGRPHD